MGVRLSWLLVCLLLACAGAQRVYFQFDTRSGDYQLGPDGSVQYAANTMSSTLGTVTVSSGTTTVNGQTIPRGMQIWTVGTTGWYDIVVGGARGADHLKQTGSMYGGRGVAVKTRYYLSAGDRIAILVGQQPTGCSSSGMYGGGGGSFVSKYSATASFSTQTQHTLILAAGGGGSVSYFPAGTGSVGGDATISTTGQKCTSIPATAVSSAGGGGGGTALAGSTGAAKGGSADGGGYSGGGGGFLGDGGDGYTSNSGVKTTGGKSFINGGVGGVSYEVTRTSTACTVSGITSPGLNAPPAGFGGGGGGWNTGSGGGGYSGGQGCASGGIGGGGGGSYDVNGAGNAGTLYSTWDTAVFGTAPTGYASGYMSSNGAVVVSTQICDAGKYGVLNTFVSSSAITFTTNGIHGSCPLTTSALDSGGGWCAATQSVNLYYLVIDAGSVGMMDSVITQGRADYDQWVTAYDLSYSTDSVSWLSFGNLGGNADRNTKVTRALNVVARYLRLTPTAYTGWPSMRAGYSFTSGAYCQTCPVGTFSLQNLQDTACTACAAGTYGSTVGLSVCAACAAGTYGPTAGLSVCTACAAGTYGPTIGLAVCAACPAGTYSLQTNRILASSCVACPANSQSSAGSTSCTANAGYYDLNAAVNLLAYYPFRPENVYADASGSGYALTDTNGASYKPQSEFSTGPFVGAGVTYMDNNNIAATAGTAKTFKVSVGSGLDLRAMIGDSITPAPGFSVCYWYRAQDGATAGTVNAIAWINGFSFGNTLSTTNYIRWIRDNANSNIIWSVINANTGVGLYTGTGFLSRSWTHVCFTLSGRTWNHYYNCISSTCTPGTNAVTGDVPNILYKDVYIGQHQWDSVWYGWFSEVRFYKKALTPAEVFAVRSYTGATAFSVNENPQLLAYYPFVSSNIYADASGNGRTLSSTNGPSDAPVYVSDTYPFAGANAVFLDNNNVAGLSANTNSFKISMGSGLNFGLIFGTAATPGPGFTFCTWYRGQSSAVNSYQSLFSIMTQPVNSIVFSTVGLLTLYRVDLTDSLSIGMRTSLGGNTLTVAGKYLNTWTHLCAAGYGQTINLYFNCSSRTCAPSVFTLGFNVVSENYPYAYIGQDYSPPWNGWISEFRMYMKALTSAEVFAIKSYDGTNPTAVNSVNAGLLAYYPFHPNAFLTDASGVTGPLAPTGSPTSIAGSMTDLQNVAYFAQAGGLRVSNGQFFSIPSITIGTSFSICIWYNPDLTAGSHTRLINLNSALLTLNYIDLHREMLTNNLALEMFNSASGGSTIVGSESATGGGAVMTGLFQLGVWQHVCLTVTGTTAKVYYNGALFRTITLSAQNVIRTFTSSYLGSNPWVTGSNTNDELYRGQLDEVRIYSRAISASEVTSIYNFRGDTYTPGIILPCPNPCVAGGYGSCDSKGVQTCTSCLAGTYSTGTGMTSSVTCAQCLAGSYSDTAGVSVCTSCNPGTFSGASSSTCTACDPGTYSTALGAQTVSTCADCSAGGYSAGGGVSVCSQCQSSTYSTGPRASVCTQCPSGSYTAGVGATTSAVCSQCEPLHYVEVSGVCESCPGTNGIGCLSSVIAVYCSSVSVYNSGGSCYLCTPGTYAISSGLTSCTPCSTGTFNQHYGASRCWSCPVGKYNPTAGASLCLACGVGSYGDTAGSSVCSGCAVGTYSGVTGASSSSVCTLCGAGTYAGVTGRSVCTKCPIATSTLTVGATTINLCLPCTAGTYTAIMGTSVCTNCPVNSWSASGASICLANTGYYNLDGNLKAYYPFNPDGFLKDVTAITGDLTTSTSVPTIQYSGPFGAGTVSAFLTGSSSTLAANNQYFMLPSLKLPNEFSVCSWYWISPSISRAWNRVFDFAVGAGNENILVTVYGSTNDLSAHVFQGATTVATIVKTDGALASVWKHFCLTLSGTSVSFWIDGIQQTITATAARNVDTLLSSSFIGRSNWPTDYYWYGAIDDFRIYTKALTATEVAALYAFRGDTYAPMIILACGTPCTAGNYGPCDGRGVVTCTACLSGSYSTGTGMTSSATCTQCLAGKFANSAGLTVCSPCTTGTYSVSNGASTCTSCLAGTYSGASGASSTATCTACGAGTYSGVSAATSVGTCTACGAGTYSGASATTCTGCGVGTYSGASATTCTSCGAGTYSGASATTCTGCGAGTYSGASATTCTGCGAGTYSGASATTCTSCGVGTYSGVSAATSIATCTACGAGTFSGATAATSIGTCTACGAGKYSDTSAGICTACGTGTYSGVSAATSIGTCTACGTGTYSDATAATSVATCTACAVGTYMDQTGYSYCRLCHGGMYGDVTGLTECSDCPTGTYLTGFGFTSIDACLTCAPGTFNGMVKPGAVQCIGCPANSWSASRASICLANTGYYNLENNLKAYYTFDRYAYLHDVTGITGDLIPSAVAPGWSYGAPFINTGQDTSAYLVGVSSSSTVAADNKYFQLPSLKLPDEFSVCSWFAISLSITRNWNRVFDFGNGAGIDNVFVTVESNTQNLNAEIFNGAVRVAGSPTWPSGAPASVWKHFCLTVSGTNGNFWLNGVSKTFTLTSARNSNTLLTQCYLGRSNWPTDNYWYGFIDDFKIYTKALTSTEVAALYAFRGNPYAPMIMLACGAPCTAGNYGVCGTACTACLAGSYSTGTGMTSSAACVQCVAGKFSLVTGATGGDVCTGCPVGTFSDTTGASSSGTCQACSAGTYTLTSGGSMCNPCSVLITCATGFARCSTNGAVSVCCGSKQYFRENTDTACQTCTVGGTGGDGSGSSCTSCTYGVVSATGSTGFTDVTGRKVYQFKSSGTIQFSTDMRADILVVGGGGAGGSAIGGGGGAGTLIFARNVLFPGTTSHTVTVGAGGTKGANNVKGGSGSASSIGTLFSAAGGGGGGAWDTSMATNGGSGGGGGACAACSSTAGTVAATSIVFGTTGISTSANVFANAGGTGSNIAPVTATLNNLHAAGGGGAGAVGGNEVAGTASCSSSNLLACGNCGVGGNGLSSVTIHTTFLGIIISSDVYDLSSTFGTAYTSVASSGFIAGGGGGGGFGSFSFNPNTCAGGAGGGGTGYRGTRRATSDDGLVNTGSGGGGGADNSPGGNGGTGLVLIRVTYTNCVCGSGTYLVSDGCMGCPAGKYGGGDGLASSAGCPSCSAGSYSTGSGMPTSGTCTLCVPGTYSATVGASSSASCTACGAGKYSITSGATDIIVCVSCLAGSYSTGTGIPSSASCSLCVPGTYSATTGASSSASCLLCGAGKYSITSGATVSSVCTNCLAGYYATGSGFNSAAQCTACLAGTYGATAGSTSCPPCAAGSFSAATGAQTCTPCSTGTYSAASGGSSSGACTSCLAGSYTLSAGLTVCTLCLPGTYSVSVGASLASTCISCSTGTYSGTTGASLVGTCTPCSAGKYSLTAGATLSSVCLSCSAGTYSGTAGASLSSTCTMCYVGLYSSASGASSSGTCLECPPGTYSSGLGMPANTSCILCSPGTYSAAYSAFSSDMCIACAAGTYATESMAVACTPCPASSSTFILGASQRGSCFCNAGYVGNLSNLASQCTSCPANSYCQGLSQSTCPLHTHSPVLSGNQGQCRCNAGYRCSYRRDVSLAFVFNLDAAGFASQSSTIKSKLATLADVPVGGVVQV